MKNNKLAPIYLGLIALLLISSCGSTKKNSDNNKNSPMNNMVARMQIKEPIKGVCDNDNVIVILPMPGNGQAKAKAPKTKEEILEDLNSKVSYLHDNPDYEDKGSMNLIVNCKGELVQ